MRYLRQSTAATVPVGPILDKADGLTPLTGVADQSANARLVKNGTGGAITFASWAHESLGHYLVGLSTAHTDTVGALRLSLSLPGTYCPVWEDFEVLSQANYDALFGTALGNLDAAVSSRSTYAGGAVASVTAGVTLAADQQVDVTKWAGTVVPAPGVTGVPRVDARYLVGADLSGYNADLKLKSVQAINPAGAGGYFQGTGGPGLTAKTTSAGYPGLNAEATTGPGIYGAGRYGIQGFANMDGGAAIMGQAATTPGLNIDGLKVTSNGTGKDFAATTTSLIVASIASFGTLVADVAAAVWAYVTRTLTSSPSPDAPTIAAAVVDQAIAGHTTAGTVGHALSTIPTALGSRQITVHLVDGSAAPVPNASVAVYDSTNTTLVRRGTTDASGNYTETLDDGTYALRLACPGYSFTVPTALVVTADATATVTGTAFVAPTPVAPTGCVVYDWLVDAAGQPVASATVRFRVHAPGVVGGKAGAKPWVAVTTDTAGYFHVELVQGARVEVEVPQAGYGPPTSALRTVPALASQQLSTWAA